ncbi:MAG: hypothetical protein PVF70_12535, partial [Anaerolineales bacterium]
MLQAEDVITAIDGTPLELARPVYDGVYPGDAIVFSVLRGEGVHLVEFRLAAPSLGVIVGRLVPLVVALVFWAVGTAAIAFGSTLGQSRLFFMACLISSAVLTSGSISAVGPSWGTSLFNSALWLLGPLLVHLHLHFPKTRAMSKWRFPLAVLYSLAVMGAIAHLIWNAESHPPSVLGEAVYAAGRLFLVLCMGIVIALLLQSYVRPGAMRVRQQIRLVCLGGILAILLFATLAILPIALIQRPLVPVQWGFAFLSLIPIFYGYAIVRHRL